MKKSLLMLCAMAFGAVASMAQVTSITVEEFYTDDATVSGYPAGHTTYRIYANTVNANDRIASIVGYNEAPLALNVPDGIWNQTEPSGIIPDEHNCSLYSFFPALQYDSYVTIGRICSSDAGGQIFALEDAGQPWKANFDTAPYGNGNILLNTTIGGTWTSLPTDPVTQLPYENLVAGDDLKVLIAQITTSGSICGSFNVVCIPDGSTEGQLYAGLSFGTGDCGTPGCTDDTALNYNPDAGFNDGTCLFPCTLEFTTVEVSDPSCFGSEDGMIMFQATGAQDIIEYTFNGGESFVDAAGPSFDGLAAGVYEFTALDRRFYNELFNPGFQYGTCEISSAVQLETFEIVFGEVAASDVSCFGANDGCALAEVSGGVGALSVDLYFTNDTPVEEAQGLPSADYCGLGGGTYYFTATDENGCSVNSADFTITQPAALNLILGASLASSCYNTEDGLQIITWGGGTGDVDWSMEDDGVYDIEGGPSTLVLNTLLPGEYTVYAQDVNGCTDNVTFTVDGPAAIEVVATPVSPTCVGDEDGSIVINATGGTGSIMYDFGCTGEFTSQDLFGPLTPGVYTICVEDAEGCGTSVEVEILPQTAVTATFDVNTISCFGAADGNFTVMAEGGAGNYQYSLNGADFSTEASFENLEVGVYPVYVMDENNCMVEFLDAIEITEPAALEVSATTEAAICFGDASGSISVVAAGGTADYSYSIGGASQASSEFNAVEAGDYTVTVVDANLCTASVDVTVAGAASELAVTVDGFGGQDADGGFINITVTGGGTPYTFDWTGSNGFDSSDEDVDGLTAGTYNVTVTDAYGCEVELSSDITITGVGELINGVSLTMTPNPTRGKVALNFSGLNGDKLSYTIMDTQGRVVVSKELGNLNGVRVENIDMTDVAAGVYYVNVRIDESTEVLKLIKQ